jgi:hypothetical protein
MSDRTWKITATASPELSRFQDLRGACIPFLNRDKMAAPRLPFLWPMLYKPTAAPRIRYTKSVTSPCKHRTFATTHRRPDEATTQRYGKAHQPAAHLREQEAPKPAESATGSKAILEKTPAQEAHSEASEKAAATQPKTPSQPSALDSPTPSPSPLKPSAAKPPDSVLYMPSPQDPSHHKPPHLKTPPYVHHFDTYGLVRELTRSSYTTAQSTTLMKAVRSLLQSNMTLARDGLVSKSSVENSTYLFRAASSELATEMGNSRKGEIERMRAERAQLRHEVDILGQRLGQETGALREEVKGLFDDRKMSVRMEQRGMETKVRNALFFSPPSYTRSTTC